jgi:hypothetical protein
MLIGLLNGTGGVLLVVPAPTPGANTSAIRAQ